MSSAEPEAGEANECIRALGTGWWARGPHQVGALRHAADDGRRVDVAIGRRRLADSERDIPACARHAEAVVGHSADKAGDKSAVAIVVCGAQGQAGGQVNTGRRPAG